MLDAPAPSYEPHTPAAGVVGSSGKSWLDAPSGGSLAGVVKVLVVLEGACAPLLIARGSDPFVFGGFESWLWPLCRAGLPHGSASGKSIEGFLGVFGFCGAIDSIGGGGGSDATRWGGFAASSEASGKDFDNVDKLGSLGTGKSGVLISKLIHGQAKTTRVVSKRQN